VVSRGSFFCATVAFASSLILAPSLGRADELGPPRDVDAWHDMLTDAVGGAIVEETERPWTLGLYPSAGFSLGPSNWVAYQVQGFVSVSDGKSFSLYLGYGYERGPSSEADMFTAGWGGVRSLHAARSQRGFYGKFLRYRRVNDFSHGIHHGLSVGTEHGVGPFGLSFEVGAVRSADNHWLATGQIALKVTVPVLIPLSRTDGTQPNT
jgi:hypothetical protein